MPHILFISPYYPPEKGAAAVCVSENARRLAQRGYTVTVLTTVPNYPTGIVPEAYRGKLVQEEILSGVRVLRVWSYVTANKGFFRRILAQLSFACLSPVLGNRRIGLPDLIIVQSPPLFDAFAARFLSWQKRCPFIFMVSDLWPESAIQLGALKNPLLIRLATWLEWSTYRRAAAIWCVTEGIRKHLLERGMDEISLFRLNNGVDTLAFAPSPIKQAREALNWPLELFTVVYAGTHGISHGLISVLDACNQLREHTHIRLVLIGDGAEKQALIAYAERLGLPNVCFLEPVAHEHMPLILSAADLCLAHVRDIPLFQGMLPIKMYEAMACERPLLLALKGEARQVAEREARAAICVEPENPHALAIALLTLSQHREQLIPLGKNGRAYVEQHFSYDRLVDELEKQIKKIIGLPQSMGIEKKSITGNRVEIEG